MSCTQLGLKILGISDSFIISVGKFHKFSSSYTLFLLLHVRCNFNCQKDSKLVISFTSLLKRVGATATLWFWNSFGEFVVAKHCSLETIRKGGKALKKQNARSADRSKLFYTCYPAATSAGFTQVRPRCSVVVEQPKIFDLS